MRWRRRWRGDSLADKGAVAGREKRLARALGDLETPEAGGGDSSEGRSPISSGEEERVQT